MAVPIRLETSMTITTSNQAVRVVQAHGRSKPRSELLGVVVAENDVQLPEENTNTINTFSRTRNNASCKNIAQAIEEKWVSLSHL